MPFQFPIMKRKILYLVLGLFVIGQFFKPEKINQPVEANMDLSASADVPPAVAQALKRACYDCHSDESVYPWYFSITPVNYYLNGHIRHGKGDINFSIWGSYSEEDIRHHKKEICEVLEENRMPLFTYAIMHRKNKLTEAEEQLICDWVKQ